MSNVIHTAIGILQAELIERNVIDWKKAAFPKTSCRVASIHPLSMLLD